MNQNSPKPKSTGSRYPGKPTSLNCATADTPTLLRPGRLIAPNTSGTKLLRSFGALFGVSRAERTTCLAAQASGHNAAELHAGPRAQRYKPGGRRCTIPPGGPCVPGSVGTTLGYLNLRSEHIRTLL